MARKVCANCHREMQDTNFYTYRNGEKTQLCKSCLTLHVDNFDESTYLWILEKMDVPYIPEEWNVIRDKAYAKNPQKMTGMSVLGKYLSKMKLKQWKQYTWADTERLQEEAKQREIQRLEASKETAAAVREQYEAGAITEAQYRTLVDTQHQKEYDDLDNLQNRQDPIGQNNMYNQNNFISEDELPDISTSLTLEDKQYLAMKWGRTYTAAEWVDLEKNYTQMMNSFDIQDADSKNTLIFICKTTLKMNQALDCGDVEGYQKLSRVYDTLRKSAKFTAAQNKQQKSQFIDSVGQLVAYCQKFGHEIPRYQIKTPYDIIDKVIMDLKDYTKSLVQGDTALSRQIEDYIKEARAAAAHKRDRAQAKERGLDAPQITEEDILDFKEFLQKEKDSDKILQIDGEDEDV